MKASWFLTVGVALLGASIASLPNRSIAADSTPGASATTAPAAGAEQSGVSKFYGTISAVDTKAMTFTVDNQVYSVVGETQMTKATDGSAATLADAVVGEPARGSFTKSAEGKLNITKVRFGKKAGGSKGGAGGKSGGKKSKEATTEPAAGQ